MRLLVSVRSADEVTAAVSGGAQIIDAKEPANGPLGAVPLDVLRKIAGRVGGAVPLSVALGDLSHRAGLRAAVARTAAAMPSAPSYIKLGFALVSAPGDIAGLIATAIDAASDSTARPVVVPVAYADWGNAGTAPPETVMAAAISAGARAFLIDTCLKDGRTLLDWLDRERLRRLARRAKDAGLLLALAGSISAGQLDEIAGLADVVGVRGAVCRGGREGVLDAELVRRFRARVDAAEASLTADERLLPSAAAAVR